MHRKPRVIHRALSASSVLALSLGLGAALFAQDQQSGEEQTATPFAYRVKVSGPITPAAAETLERAIARAEEDGARALIVHLDTPGGLVTSMDDMVRRILAAHIPVITYVYPPGASCGSAGVFLMYASHVAAMAPGTNIGSATPVTQGGGFGGGEEAPRGDDRIPETAGADDALNMKRKLMNHALAQIRTLAQYHGRNQEFGERTITRAENVTANEALRLKAIDLIAEDEADLLRQIEGRSVRMLTGQDALQLRGIEVRELTGDFRNRVLGVLSHPQVAMILMMVGILGIMAEVFYAPGSIFPGAIGAICLVLGLYALQTLPVDYTGLALIGLGVLFFVLEIKITSYGLLSIAGVISMVLGSLMLFQSGDEFLSGAASTTLTIAILSSAAMAAIAYLAAKSQRRPLVSGAEQLKRESAVARTDIDSASGQAFVHGELWEARSEGDPIVKGAKLRVIRREALTLFVRPE